MRQTSIYGKLLAMAGCAALVCALGVGTGHAASVTAEATGQVIKPIGVVVGANLDFGRFMSGASSGTIAVTAAGVAQVTGGVGAVPGNVPVAATFDVSGEASTGFSISMPDTVTLTNTDGVGGETMEVTLAKDAVAAAGTGTLDGTGALAVKVGGAAAVGVNQVSGHYENTADFTVVVNYN